MAFDERGLPLAHEVFEGNMSDTKTLLHILDRLHKGVATEGNTKMPLVILDAGFASKANLALLTSRGYGYLINITRGSRAGFVEDFAAGGFETLPGRDPETTVEVRCIPDPEHPEGRLVLCRSALCGNYVLRTDQQLGATRIWSLYMTLLQAEEGYACLKGSLGLRPNFHQLEDRVDAHIFISVLAYHLLCWVRENLRAKGDVRDWKTLRRLLSTHSLVTTCLPLEDGRVLHIRKASIPDAEQAQVYQKLGIDWKSEFPPQKRFVKS